jgi:hypothetical protein
LVNKGPAAVVVVEGDNKNSVFNKSRRNYFRTSPSQELVEMIVAHNRHLFGVDSKAGGLHRKKQY